LSKTKTFLDTRAPLPTTSDSLKTVLKQVLVRAMDHKIYS